MFYQYKEKILIDLDFHYPMSIQRREDIYSGCDDNTEVEFYKVNGAGHVWLGSSNDIFYTTEIWEFFRKHQNSGSAALNSIKPISKVSIYPNPSKEFATLEIHSNFNETFKINLIEIYLFAICVLVEALVGKVLADFNLPALLQPIHLLLAMISFGCLARIVVNYQIDKT